VYGPDQRTRLSEATRRALFTTYAPEGVSDDAARQHLTELATLAQVVAPAANVRLIDVYPSRAQNVPGC
jgi:DNA/RNA-binding domain of Phe-tRNA-synthetase-like protein